MDGNSTMSLGQFFSGYSELFLSFILVIITGILAYYTKNLYHATSKYVDLVGSQNQIMDEQNKMMDENRKHELLVKKYNRMLDEMKNLIAPLYASRDDPQIFIPIKLDSKIITDLETSEIDQIYYNSYEFWMNIRKNIYLNGSEELKKQLRKYEDSLRHPSMKRDERRDKYYSRMFEKNNKILVDIIEHRHCELAEQIKDIEEELGISESSQLTSNPKHEDT